MAPSNFPCEDKVPERFAKSANLKLWYCEGFQDGATERSMQDQQAVRRHQGDWAWEAYCLGYEAGTKRRLEEKAASAS